MFKLVGLGEDQQLMELEAGSQPVGIRRSAPLLRPRLIAAILALSIPLWWMGLRGWAESTSGYLEVDAMGISPFAWIGMVALSAAILAIRPARLVRVVGLGVLAVAGALLGFHNLAVGLEDGMISMAGWAMAGLSLLQLALVLTGALVSAEQ